MIDPQGDIAGNDYSAVRPALNLRIADLPVPTAMNRTPAEVEAELAEIAAAQIEDVVAFGRYTWYVTDKTDGICTLLCQGPVADMPYNDTKTDITWENCSLRRWLNEDFYNSKFSDGEKAAIVTSHNTYVEDDYHYESDCGNDTDDKVYIFSYSEALAVSDSCTTLNAMAGLGGTIVESLQKVYIIPAGNGTVVATAHYTFEAAEGFGHRFDYMMNTLVVTDSDH